MGLDPAGIKTNMGALQEAGKREKGKGKREKGKGKREKGKGKREMLAEINCTSRREDVGSRR